MSVWHGCKNCGLPLSHIVDSRGDRWIHTVEPTGHEAEPSRDVALGRARAMADLAGQMKWSLEKGQAIDEEWVRNWTEWFGNPALFPSSDEENAAYAKAMGR